MNPRKVPVVLLLALLLLLAVLSAEARDPGQVRAFRKDNPCPSTGRVYGACPNYQVDHRRPLKCGGADRPHNMQWLTIRDHKAKTAREARLCRKTQPGSRPSRDSAGIVDTAKSAATPSGAR